MMHVTDQRFRITRVAAYHLRSICPWLELRKILMSVSKLLAENIQANCVNIGLLAQPAAFASKTLGCLER